jgi:hypothetical protein
MHEAQRRHFSYIGDSQIYTYGYMILPNEHKITQGLKNLPSQIRICCGKKTPKLISINDKKKGKAIPYQAVKAQRVVRCRGSHIF